MECSEQMEFASGVVQLPTEIMSTEEYLLQHFKKRWGFGGAPRDRHSLF